MNNADFDTLLAERQSVQPFIFSGDHVERDAPLPIEFLGRFEREIGVKLPAQYKRFLSQHGAGDFAFTSVYSPDPSSDWFLNSETDYLPTTIRARFLPFADNGAGDYYGFVISDGACSDAVFWADHELDYDITPSEYTNFNDFLARVALNQ